MDAQSSFSVDSRAYAENRPTYPAELFSWMASNCSSRERAWDCGTGNGQAALALGRHFASVEATDLSEEQVRYAFRADNVRYSAQTAEHTDFKDSCFDLVTVAQALHWFDLKKFWTEVRRVSKPGAFFCAWGYSWFQSDAELQSYFVRPMLELFEPYWAANNRLLWNGYAAEEIGLPFKRVTAPSFAIEMRWKIADVVAYVRTWSAYKRAVADASVTASVDRLEGEALLRFAVREEMSISMPLTVAAASIT